ncbi:class I SAM-dependent DNA methyltransferase, partial [Vibrio parahaemolyticus]|nr:class I SAM-dependent DNA methyltransferase [Vibrio parahaemolyticus]
QRNQSKEHQKDMDVVFDGIKNYKNLDYISCWFMKASRYINNKSAFAFVTTNSLCQGTQVEMLWPHIFKMNLEISFAYRNIKWTNNAKNSAGVTVSIVGLSKRSNLEKRIYTDSSYLIASNISPYLVEGENLFATKRKSPLASLPNIEGGNQPREGGFLTLSNDEKEKLVSEFPDVDKYIRPLIGSSEFL